MTELNYYLKRAWVWAIGLSVFVLGIQMPGDLMAQSKKAKSEDFRYYPSGESSPLHVPIVKPIQRELPPPFYNIHRSGAIEAFQVVQDFEDATFPPTGWSTTGTIWSRSTAASGYGIGVASAKSDFYNVQTGNHELILPALTATVAGDTLVFDHAYATYSTPADDSLYVDYSTDGGTSWLTIVSYSGLDPVGTGMVTAPPTGSAFVPTAGQWGTKRLAVPVGTNKIRFLAATDYGNNLYIDNIYVGQPDTNDIAAFSYDDPLSGSTINPNQTFTPLASFKNVGTMTQSNVSVKYEINSGTNIYSSTKVIASIAAGATEQVTFDPVTGGIPSGAYTLRLIVLTPDQNVANDTLNGTLNVSVPISGTKTIGGTTPDYASFTDAITALGGGVGAGGVTFMVRPGNYGVDAGTEGDTLLQIDPVFGAGATSQIVFMKESGTVTVHAHYLGIILNGADYVTFDGIDVTQHAGAGRTLNSGYFLTNYSSADGAQYNTLKNFTVTLNDTTSSTQSRGVSVAYSFTPTSASGASSYNKIYNFNISGGSWGMFLLGDPSIANPDVANEIGTDGGGSSFISAVAGTSAGFNCGIYYYGQTGLKIYDVDITGSQAAAASLYGITANGAASNGTASIFNNRISGMILRANGNLRGIQVVIPGTYEIYANEVFDCTHLTTGTSYIAGIAVEGGTGNMVTIYNNLISDLKNPGGTATTSPNIRGINLSGGATLNVYHNTVYLDAPNSSASRSSAALYITATPTMVDYRNNILVNKSAIGSGASTRQAALFKSTTSLTNLATTSNNNLLYAGVPTFNKRLIFYNATNSDSTLDQYKARVIPRDAAAVTEDVSFSNTLVPPYDLHIDTGVPTQVDSGGQGLASVTTDFDGDLRNATYPDIGADEGNFIRADTSGPAIAYTPLGDVPAIYATRTLNATISDLSGVPTTGIGLPVLYWKIGSAGSYTAATASHTGGSGYEFTFGTGAVLGDTVFYYVCAQDNWSTIHVSAFPAVGASGLTPNPPAAAVPPTTPSSYRIVADVHDYTVSKVDLSPAFVAGDLGSVMARVTNLGNVPETGGIVKLFEDGIQVGSDGAITLNPGETGTVSFDYTPSVTGLHNYLVHSALTSDGTPTNDTVSFSDMVYAAGNTGATIAVYSTDASRPFTNTSGRFDTLAVSTGSNYTVNRVRMTLDSLTHTWVSDIDMFFFGPNGDSLEITTDNGSSGDHFIGTAFTDMARTSITSIVLANAPFTGYFRPEGATGFAKYRGIDPNGDWILRSLDDASGDNGDLRRWSIFVDVVIPPNLAPSAFDLLSPPDGSRIVTDATSSDSFFVTWTMSIDPEAQPVTYTIVSDTSASFGSPVETREPSNNGGADTVLTSYLSDFDDYLASLGVAYGDSIMIYWKVEATDGINTTTSNQVFGINAVRAPFVPVPGWNVQTSGTTNALYSVKAVSQTVAWAGGAGGTVLRTIDGGNNWENVGSSFGDVYNITALDQWTAFVTTTPSATYIYRTTDGGQSWQEVYNLTGGFIDAIHMFDATNGIAYGDPVGGEWVILRTTDGGASWYRIATEPIQAGSEAGWNNAMSVVGTDRIWFGTNNTRVYYTTDGGLTWGFAATTGTTNTYAVEFIDEMNGVAGGTAGVRTTDGGLTWFSTAVSGTGTIYGIGSAGTKDFWVARGANVHRSTNVGESWSQEYTGTLGTLYGTDFTTYSLQTTGYVVSSTGGIAGYYGDVTIVGIGEGDQLPKAFALHQNFPNPFNPTTTIKYDVKEPSRVVLKVYNILGQEVRTLVNQKETAGFKSITWDGKNNHGQQVASGIYVYRVQMGNFVKSRKMMLVK
jgi:photosystem II stability/assembly factor-like uncharacterized protein